MARIGFILDEDFDLAVEKNSVAVGEIDEQNVNIILLANKGEYKFSPEVGVGLANFLRKQVTELRKLRREINVQLQNDGYQVTSFSVDSNNELVLDYKLK